MIAVLKLAYKFLPKNLINWIGKNRMLQGIRTSILRPDGKLVIHRDRITFDGASFIFQAPMRTLVKASTKGIEPGLIRHLKRVIRDTGKTSYNFFDIGANYGFVSLALRAGDPNISQVVMFEPHPRLHGLLEESISLNQFRNVKVEHLAVGDQVGKIKVNIYENTANVLTLNENTGRGAVDVDQMPIDKYVADTGIQPDFIKIDVDGYEINVLNGMRNTIAACRPVIVVETNESPELIELLIELGYDLFDDEQFLPVTIENIPRNNIFCIPRK